MVALMIGKIVFTVIAFVLFIYILLFKMIKKNDTTYLAILGMQAIGILLNLIKINFDIFTRHIMHNNTIFVMHNNTISSISIRSKKYKCVRNVKNYNS